jgi:hypothetical protein
VRDDERGLDHQKVNRCGLPSGHIGNDYSADFGRA